MMKATHRSAEMLRNERQTIRYGVAPCSLGRMLVARSDRGICAIELGEEDSALVQQLARRFPAANLEQAGPEFREVVSAVIEQVDGARNQLDLPLDIQGTAFQQAVWQSLQQIPAGSTVSYATLAERIGNPKAVRAVAGACAANPLAVAIPCHRVVRSDGNLSGYRWGIERKRSLLARESSLASERTRS